MAELTKDQLATLLAVCIKEHGKDGVLHLPNVELAPNISIRLHTVAGNAILVLLEGQEQIDSYDAREQELEAITSEISKRGGEPDEQAK
jgi:hypothetical protein